MAEFASPRANQSPHLKSLASFIKSRGEADQQARADHQSASVASLRQLTGIPAEH